MRLIDYYYYMAADHQDRSTSFSDPAKLSMVLGIPGVAHKVSPTKYEEDCLHQFVRLEAVSQRPSTFPESYKYIATFPMDITTTVGHRERNNVHVRMGVDKSWSAWAKRMVQ